MWPALQPIVAPLTARNLRPGRSGLQSAAERRPSMATIEELKRELDECYVRMTFAAGRAMAGLTSTMVDQVKLTAGSAHQAHEKARE